MGPWGVEATAARLADFHGALLCSVHCLGAWIAAVPELETKIQWACHLYEQAHHADLIGRRIYDLTAERPQVSSPANRSLLAFFRELTALQSPAEQTAGIYHLLLPAMLVACRDQIERTNPVADEPTVRLLHRLIEDLENQVIWGSRQPGDSVAAQQLSLVLAEAGGFHGPGAAYNGAAIFTPRLTTIPARDDRFQLLKPGKKMPRAMPLQSAEGRIRLLHIALINLEIPAMEICGRMIAEYPEAPWQAKLDLAHQMWDEARHAQMCADRLQELGGSIGQYPYHHRLWEHAIQGQSLVERFATTQRIHEGNGLDQRLLARDALARVGDMASSQIMDYMVADEVLHVRAGNRWIEHFLPDLADRQRLFGQIEARLGSAAVLGPPLNKEGRRKAGFTEIELDGLAAIRERRNPNG